MMKRSDTGMRIQKQGSRLRRWLGISLVSVAMLTIFGLSAEAQTRFRILANGGFHATTSSFGGAFTFTEFLEEARLTRDYDTNTGAAFEFGGIFSITRNFGVMGSFEIFNGDNGSRFERIAPHPLLFNQDRVVSGEVPGLSYSERAIHLAAVYTQDFSSFTVDLFGGPTLFRTETELLGNVRTISSYPFDEATLAGTDRVKLDDNPLGFNVGGALTYRLNPTFGLAFTGRFSRATAKLEQENGSPIEFDTGGFRIGAGIRIAF